MLSTRAGNGLTGRRFPNRGFKRTSDIPWRRKGSIIGLVLISLFLLGTALSDLNRYFNIQPHPAFMIKRTFADHCVNLLKEGYYLEIGQSDLHFKIPD